MKSDAIRIQAQWGSAKQLKTSLGKSLIITKKIKHENWEKHENARNSKYQKYEIWKYEKYEW